MANKIEDQLTASSLITAPEYMVCGVVLSSRLTAEEYARLEDYEHERDLIGLRAKLDKLQDKNSKDNRDNTPPEYGAQLNKIATLEAARNAKLEGLQNDPMGWDDDKDDAYLAALETKIAAAYTKLGTLPQPDPAAVLRATTQNQKDLNNLNHEFRLFYLPYGHWLATERGLTKDKLEVWEKRAEPQDYANVQEVVKKGKALRLRFAASAPHVRTPAEMQN